MAASQIDRRCTFFESFSHPKIHTPKKVDSMKKATNASIAKGAPKISPTKREYPDQFMPNWNSWMIPVTTPMEKLIKNNLPQNLAMCLYFSSPVFTYTDSMTAVRNDRPMVSGTNKKW